MLGDTSSQQATQKFSFIESLNLSKKSNRHQTSSASKNRVVEDDLEACGLTVTEDDTASIDTGWYSLDTAAYDLDVAEIIQQCAVDNSSHSSPRSYLGKILFALACSYCLFVFWWLFGHEGTKILTALTGGKQIVLAKSDVQFIDYMERSLDSIERKIEANKLASGQDEIVYVPMYTPAAPPPQIASNIPTSIPNITHPQPPTTVKPEPVAPQALKIPAPPPLPAPTPIPDDSSSIEVATNIKPVKHTLIGILELGENQSAALVKIQGKTRRVWQGDEIGNSGWILDSIGNQNAKISNRGQVRSISVGETF